VNTDPAGTAVSGTDPAGPPSPAAELAIVLLPDTSRDAKAGWKDKRGKIFLRWMRPSQRSA
jgi:hypothetical protein